MNNILNMEDAARGFKPIFSIIGYKTDKCEYSDNKEGYYLEIAPIVNGVQHASQPLSKKAIHDIKMAFDVELYGPEEINYGWTTPEIIYINNRNKKSSIVYYEPAGMQKMFIGKNEYALPKPGLLFFVKDNILSVWAFADAIPNPESDLFSCPFTNTMEQGRICLGNAKSNIKRDSFANELSYWKSLYWNSTFEGFPNHVTAKYSLKAFRASKVFKKEWLIPTKQKLKDIIK